MSLDYLLPHPPCERSPRTTHPYQSSLSSSASSSASSIFSIDALSQSSQSSVIDSLPPSTSEASWRFADTCSVSLEPPATAKRVLPLPRTCTAPVAPEQRQNPRRCSLSANRPPPALVRQSERKGQFVDCLVDSATQMVEVIWPTSVPACRGDSGRGVLPLRTFIQETLRRSRTSFSTLQVALYYLILVKDHVPRYDFTMEQPDDAPAFRALQCGRRMFLAALILASKYLQDRNYSARAWSKISGLKVCEININEMAFLTAVQWKLHIKEAIFEKWQDIILHYTPSSTSPLSPGGMTSDPRWMEWKLLVQRLNPDLEGVAVTPRPLRLGQQPRKAATWPLPPPSPITPTTPVTPTPRSTGLSTSTESTPTPTAPVHLPHYFEPRLDVGPPTPARLGPLPTPSMTPQSIASASIASTPAAGVSYGIGPRRPSMCAAMQTAHSAFSNRIADQWSYMGSSRRPSLVPSITMSMNSSPESMVSDASSRSSRASSISSASSVSSSFAGYAQACNSTPVKLARLATLRCARLGPMKEMPHIEPEIVDTEEGITIEPMSSPDFESFHIHDVETPSASIPDDMAKLERMDSGRSCVSTTSTSSYTSEESASCDSPLKIEVTSPQTDMRPSSCFADFVKESTRSQNRKRGRSSVDLSLHQNVRSLLVPETRALSRGGRPRSDVSVDDVVANSFILNGKTLEMQSPARSVPCVERRLPVLVQRDGRKRACCAKEVERRWDGPGMWEGVL